MFKLAKHTTPLHIVLIIIIGFAIYSNSTGNPLFWDDDFLIKNNLSIRNLNNIPRLFQEDIGAGSSVKTNFYRPLQMVSYVFNYAFAGLNPTIYHLTNIYLHILVAILVYFLAYFLFKQQAASFFSSVLFLVCPMHTEAVTYIAGRADLLSALFVLSCLIFYIKQNESNRKYYVFLISFSYLLALLSKESSLVVPVLLMLYSFIYKKRTNFRDLYPVFITTFIYFVLRITILKFPQEELITKTTVFQRIPGFFVAVTDYLRLLILPNNLHMEYPNKLFLFYEPKVIIGAIITLVLFIYAFVKRKSNKLISFSIFWFFLALLPVSNLYPIGYYMAEHWLYLASIGFFFALGFYLSLLYKQNKVKYLSVVLFLVILSYYSYFTIRQNYIWKDPAGFFKYTLQYAPDNPKIYNNLCHELVKFGRYNEAITFCNKAIALKENYAEAYYNLGDAYVGLGNYLGIIKTYSKAIEIDPGFPTVGISKQKINEAIIALKIIKEHATNFRPAALENQK